MTEVAGRNDSGNALCGAELHRWCWSPSKAPVLNKRAAHEPYGEIVSGV